MTYSTHLVSFQTVQVYVDLSFDGIKNSLISRNNWMHFCPNSHFLLTLFNFRSFSMDDLSQILP